MHETWTTVLHVFSSTKFLVIFQLELPAPATQTPLGRTKKKKKLYILESNNNNTPPPQKKKSPDNMRVTAAESIPYTVQGCVPTAGERQRFSVEVTNPPLFSP